MFFPCTGHHLHHLPMHVTFSSWLVVFQTKWLCYTMLLSQEKETRVQWLSLTPWRSTPRQPPAGYCWGSVRSAALCLAGGKQMDKLHTHVRTVLRKTWLLIPLAYPKTNDPSASLKCVDQTKVLHQQPPGSYNGIKIRTLTHSNTQTHANVIITLKAMAIWRLRANTAFTLNTKQGITQNIATDDILAHYQQN